MTGLATTPTEVRPDRAGAAPSGRALRLGGLLVVLMAVQSGSGLLLADRYLDPAWIRATWWGNDWVTYNGDFDNEYVVYDYNWLIYYRNQWSNLGC